MSQIYFTHDTKANSVSLRGRGINATFPSNGYLVASASTDYSDTIDFHLPGSVAYEIAVPRLSILDGVTGLKLGATAAAVVTTLNDDYLNASSSIASLDDVFYDPTATTPGAVLHFDATDTWSPRVLTAADVSALADTATANDLADIDTTGVATGDGLRYDGSDFVAGKWGLGTEDQTVPANETDGSVGTTSRTITLGTETDFPSRLVSVSTLDIKDSGGNLLERVQMTTTDVGAGDVSTATQEKYGRLVLKPDNYGTDAEIVFGDAYGTSTYTTGLKMGTGLTSSWSMMLPPTRGNAGDVLTIDSTTSVDAITKWAAPTGGGGGSNIYTFTDQGRRQWSSTQDNHYNVGDASTGLYDTSETYVVSSITGTGTADLFAFNGFTMPANITSEITVTGHCNTFTSGCFGEDVELELWKIALTSGDDCTVTSMGSTTVTLGSASGDMSTYTMSITSGLPSAGEIILPTFRFPNLVSSATFYLRYGFTLTAS